MKNGENGMNKEEFDKVLDRTDKIHEGIGALKIINKITDNFKVADGSIYIPYTEWIKFMTPYTELPVEEK
jgi:hypothetical protein